MNDIPACPECTMENTYPDGESFICADCSYEWPIQAEVEAEEVVKDANGNTLNEGDTVVLIKDLKVKGSSTTLKVGTKIKGIRIIGGDHPVDCKTPAGKMLLKAEFLKKV